MITADSPFVAPPRISARTFASVMAQYESPWEAQAGELYHLIAERGHDPAVWLAIGVCEHGLGSDRDSVLWRHDTRSWTNARSVRDPAIAGWSLVFDEVRRSSYVRYADVADSLRDGCYRITDPTYRYVIEGRATIRQVLAIWTEGDSARYTADVVALVNQWITVEGGTMPQSDIPGVEFVAADERHHTPGRPAWPDILNPHHTNGYDSLDWLTTDAKSNVSSTYLFRHDGTIRAQLVRHADTPHTAAGYNPRIISAEWERKWPEQKTISDGQYENMARSWLAILQAERRRGNPHFAGPLRREQFRSHRELYPGATACPGNLDLDRLHRRIVELDAAQPVATDPHAIARDIAEILTHPDGREFHIPRKFWQYIVAQTRGDQLQVIRQFGHPISGAFIAANGLLVQWFERARLEYHPEAAGTPWEIQTGRVGAELLDLVRAAVERATAA